MPDIDTLVVSALDVAVVEGAYSIFGDTCDDAYEDEFHISMSNVAADVAGEKMAVSCAGTAEAANEAAEAAKAHLHVCRRVQDVALC